MPAPFPCPWASAGPLFEAPPSQAPLPELERLLSSALQCGGSILEDVRLEPFGAEAWIHDPEGNALLLLAPLAFGASIS